MTRILVGHRGGVDFGSPVQMTDAQRAKFIDFLNHMFAVVDVEPVDEFRTERLGAKIFQRAWTADELRYLLDFEDTETVCEQLGRSWMSIDLMRGHFIPELLEWAERAGYNVARDDTKRLIEEFLKEKKLLAQQRREHRTKYRGECEELRRKRLMDLGLLEARKALIREKGREDLKATLEDLAREIGETESRMRRLGCSED